MSITPKANKSAHKGAVKKASQNKSVSSRIGLIFPVGRVGSMLRRGRYTKRVAAAAPVYLTAVLEYLCAEVLELSGNVAAQQKKRRITPRAVTLAVRHDDELSSLLSNVTFMQGGVAPNLHDVLKKKKGSRSKATPSQQV